MRRDVSMNMTKTRDEFKKEKDATTERKFLLELFKKIYK